MIIVKLKGGLGNQLFEYATARRAAYSNNTALKVDLANYSPLTERRYSLPFFNVKVEIASKDEIEFLKPPSRKSFYGVLRWLIKFFKPYYALHHVTERPISFDSNILKARNNTYLEGYWQSENYFIDIRPLILKELSLKNPLSAKAGAWAKEITAINSISIHIRRCDFITNKHISEEYETCGTEYYLSAMRYMTSKVENPKFFVFSDDIQWAKENIFTDNPISYVSDGTLEDYEELALMSLCRYNISSNSSFGWWGVWLNNHSNKIVIAPKKWFRNPARDDKHIVPESWLKM